MKFLIITTDESTLRWKSLPTKLDEIEEALTTRWDVDIKFLATTPKFIGGRIEAKWFTSFITPYFNAGVDVIGLHMTNSQKKAWGITPTLRGGNQIDGDEIGEFYFWADESTKRNGLSQFVQTCLHEFSHEFFQQTKLSDQTHTYHGVTADISGLIKSFDWNLYQPRRMNLKKQKNLLETLVELYKRLLTVKSETRPLVPTVTNGKGLLPLVERQAYRLLVEMDKLGLPIRITEGYRTHERQSELYAQGRSARGQVVTNAKAGESYHNWGCAIDIYFLNEGYKATNLQWKTLASVAEDLGFEWGGSESWEKAGIVDKPHLQLTLGYTIQEFQKKLIDYNKFK